MDSLQIRAEATESLYSNPHDVRALLRRSKAHLDIGYPELAATDAYLAILGLDEIEDESGEFHEETRETFLAQLSNGDPSSSSDETNEEAQLAACRMEASRLLVGGLSQCGCFATALEHCKRAAAQFPEEDVFKKGLEAIPAAWRLWKGDPDASTTEIADVGLARREVYPWNDHEPDRFSVESLAVLEELMANVAPKLEVRATELPTLDGSGTSNKQLGVFAKEDIASGEILLTETSLLTINNNRDPDELCDACSVSLDKFERDQLVACPDCNETLFCSQKCYEVARDNYHPILCDMDISQIGKDAKGKAINDALYFLLLFRAMALAHTREIHPLQMPEVKYIWGDFERSTPSVARDFFSREKPKGGLPFSWEYDFKLPLHVITTLEIPIFPYYDPWVLLTLLSKFRGTASARVSLRDGRPEVAAVHPMWCLANHSCAPNVTWEWGADIVLWCVKGKQKSGREGVKMGEEIWNHYCDVDLDYKERREWARGALGGDCMCPRCIEEEKAERHTLKKYI